MKMPDLINMLFSLKNRARIEEAIKNVQDDGISLGAGDYVDVADLKALCDGAAYMLKYIVYLESRVHQAEWEKQALLHDVLHVIPVEFCEACAHAQEESKCEEYDFDCEKCQEDCPCKNCRDGYPNFKWRGVCPENTKEESNAD